MTDKPKFSQLSNDTQLMLRAANDAVIAETGSTNYKELSAVVRDGLKKSLKNVESDQSTSDGREVLYNLVEFEIWDVTAGEDNADKEAEAPAIEDVQGLDNIFLHIQNMAGQFHGTENPPPPELRYEALSARGSSLRSVMSRYKGRPAPFRVRYTIGDANYLICSLIERAGKEITVRQEDDAASPF